MTKKAERAQRASEAKEYLLKYCPRGSITYCVLRHCSKSGLRRAIQLCVVDPADGQVVRVGHWAAQVLDRRFDCDLNGVVCQGAGMDSGFELVYSLSCALYGREERGGYELTHEWI